MSRSRVSSSPIRASERRTQLTSAVSGPASFASIPVGGGEPPPPPAENHTANTISNAAATPEKSSTCC